MSSFKLVGSSTTKLHAATAKEFAEMKGSPTERDLNLPRVKHLRAKADQGLLTPFNWTTAIVDGEKYRMNGQHSSHMLVEMAKEGVFPEDLIVHLDEYEVETMQDLALLFRQYDDRKSSRSPADVSGAYQGLQADLLEIDRKLAKLAVEGMVWYKKDIQEQPNLYSGDDRYKYFNEERNHPFIHFVGSELSAKTPEMKRAQVVAAMFGTFELDHEKATTFWEQVSRGGVEYEEDHPTSVLASWLLRAYNKEFRTTPHADDFYNACVYAWNAWMAKRSIKEINIYRLKQNLTPHTG